MEVTLGRLDVADLADPDPGAVILGGIRLLSSLAFSLLFLQSESWLVVDELSASTSIA